MARTNKYNSLNFNEIYEKKFTNNNNSNINTNNNHNSSAKPHNNTLFSSSTTTSSSSANNVNKTIISNSRIHGHMLVMTRPTPKPISIPQKQPQQQDHHVLQEKQPPLSSTPPDRTGAEPDSISLRPQGRTGPGLGLSSSPLPSPVGPASPLTSPMKTDKFVPPHLRPGFAGREEKPGPGQGGRVVANREFGGHRQGHLGSSPNRYGEDGRPKSGGGYERITRGGGVGVGVEADPVEFMNRPGSSGARPGSSGH